jgi:L-ascorbate metabolism protein UlaG (beta-lactamase superfamily)
VSGSSPKRSPLSTLVPAFGDNPYGERMERIRRSPNFSDGVFTNPVSAGAVPSKSMLRFARTYFRKEERVRRAPTGRIPLYAETLTDLGAPPASGLRLTWMGHSTVLTEIDGRRVLFDPVWGERCSPFSFVGPKRLHEPPVPLKELGEADAIVISHDHYDHLDMPTIKALAGTATRFVVPLGVGAHLERWGVSADRMTELDWAIRNTQHTLWASWVVAGPEHRVYHSGDTGYFSGFAEIGAEYGPFDATMVQIGAYSDFWPDIHMTPEEGVRAHQDLRGALMLPIHWGTFNLAPHPWEEPAEGTVAAARAMGARVAVPRPGEPFEPAAGLPLDPWWRAIAHGAAMRTWPSLGDDAQPAAPQPDSAPA